MSEEPPTRRERLARLTAELSKFGVMAVVSTLLAVFGTIGLHLGLRLGPLASNAIATVVAVSVSFAGNRCWIFRDRRRTNLAREYLAFFVLNGLALLIQLFSIGFTVCVLDLHDTVSYDVSLLVGVTLASLARYLTYKKWVFLPADEPRAPSHDRTRV
ncbi:GtrA family protein [Actinomadura violacea]|uniref:GtrA family protein n=1 Tax=Actinomadura violacea TaxID=2819934 RepID=A0ABS3S0W0_9ACTN|nr:GtrA family protein [Actinomadura violacea]MBO2462650.1 GtrA family protein [Actinomadura violacea]